VKTPDNLVTFFIFPSGVCTFVTKVRNESLDLTKVALVALFVLVHFLFKEVWKKNSGRIEIQ
jgi:hypothetical protein